MLTYDVILVLEYYSFLLYSIHGVNKLSSTLHAFCKKRGGISFSLEWHFGGNKIAGLPLQVNARPQPFKLGPAPLQLLISPPLLHKGEKYHFGISNS
jgi:hypothetical protein